MSIQLMTWVWKNATVKGNELLLLLALADMANDSGQCWPSIATLAKKTRLSKRYVIDLLQNLETGGYLTRQHRCGDQGDAISNLYHVLAPDRLNREDPHPAACPDESHHSEPQFTPAVTPAALPREPQITTGMNSASLPGEPQSITPGEPAITTVVNPSALKMIN